MPGDWSGPIIVRSVEYFSHLPALLQRHQKRVIHNSMILLFVLNSLPPTKPSAMTCTKSTIWAMPQVSSALYLTQHPANVTADNINRVGGELLFLFCFFIKIELNPFFRLASSSKR